MIKVGPMQLNQPEPLDPMEPYFNGTQADGGLHTDMARLSAHDHSGGLLGGPVAVTIPDGSITAADLDPSVLAPYALTDGSKPFTGEVTLQADAVIRDALRFGQQGSALAPDATLSRVSAGALRVDTHLGVGVNPAAWHSDRRVVQTGVTASLMGSGSVAYLELAENSYLDAAAAARAIVTGAAARVTLSGGTATFMNAPSVAAGVTQTFTNRMTLAPTGTLTLTPDAGQAALAANIGSASLGVGPGTLGGSSIRVSSAGHLELDAISGYIVPSTDNTRHLGGNTTRFIDVWSVAGTIQTSAAAVKEGITPLSPSECYEAAKAVKWFAYAYLPPAYTPPEPPPGIAYDAADDNDTKAEKKAKRDEAEAASKAAHLKMVAETAPARHQRGFVFGGAEAKDESGEPLPPVPELFGLSDRASTTPQADLATLGAALQHLIAKVEALEAGGAA